MTADRRPLVAVKLHPVGRAQTFVVADGAVDHRLQRGGARSRPDGRRPCVRHGRPPAFRGQRARTARPTVMPISVVRRASQEDVVARLQQQQHEREAYPRGRDEGPRAWPGDEAHACRAGV